MIFIKNHGFQRRAFGASLTLTFDHELELGGIPLKKRIVIIFCIFCGAFTFLYLKLASFNFDEFYVQTAENQSSYTLEIPAERGTIYDYRFRPLVNRDEKYYAAVVPNEDNISLISEHLVGVTEGKKIEYLQNLTKSGKPFVCEVDTGKLAASGVSIFVSSERYANNKQNDYENNQLATHIIGYLDDEKNGVVGLEKSYNDMLTSGAESTKITYTLDGVGDVRSDIPPKISYGTPPSSGLVTTIDRDIQAICEKVGAKNLEKGAIVVMEIATGKLRAVASFPDYSLDSLEIAVSDEENSPMLNRALNATAVGSTFKIVTTAAAVKQGISASDVYTCDGNFPLGVNNFHCHKRDGHGELDLKNALMVSCNPFFISLGLEINPEIMLQTANDFSFGKQAELAPQLISQAGNLPTLEELLKDNGNMANFSFGQGVLSATPIQIAQMVSTVANGGFAPAPILCEGISQDGKTLAEPAKATGVEATSEYVANTLDSYLTACVMEQEGQNARPRMTTAAGKTGTAQTGVFVGNSELCNGWFAGYFPAESPKYAVAVLSENAVSGNENASPTFRDIADAVMALQ